MSPFPRTTMGRALLLGGVTGLRAALGPALIAASRRSEGREALALAALAELLADKMPFTPGRDRLPALLPRVLAGYWVARQVAQQDRVHNPAIPIAGAAAAAGAALIAPKLRSALGLAFRLPDPALGGLEDLLAIALGSSAARLSVEDLGRLISGATGEAREQVSRTSLPVPSLLRR